MRYRNGSEDSTKFRAGYSHCTAEVSKVLGGMSDITPELQNRVISHLSKVGQSINFTSNNNSNMTYVQNSVNVNPPQTQVILVTVPNTQTVQVLDGNSLGVVPQLTVIPAPGTTTATPQRIQIIPTVVPSSSSPDTNSSTVNVTQKSNVQIQNQNQIQQRNEYTTTNEAIDNLGTMNGVNETSSSSIPQSEVKNNTPILSSLFTSVKTVTNPVKSNSSKESSVLNSSISSNSSTYYDSAIGTDVTDNSDNDMSSSMSSPVSSPGCSEFSWRDASSPFDECSSTMKTADTKPRNSSPPCISPLNLSNRYRETLTPQTTWYVRRPPLIAPKPSTSDNTSYNSRPLNSDKSNITNKTQTIQNPKQPVRKSIIFPIRNKDAQNAMDQSSNMWRPW